MLDKNAYFIREHVGMLKLTDTYDILDPETQAPLGIAKEEISGGMKLLRFLINKQMLPTCVNVYSGTAENQGERIFSIKRHFAILSPKVEIVDSTGVILGYLKTKSFSFKATFHVLDPSENKLAEVKGDWKGWNFKFLSEGEELGTITKKWSGIGKELFTSADNYMIQLNGNPDATVSTLLLAAGLAVDIIFKEK